MNKKSVGNKDAADKLVKNIRRRTSRKYSAEEKIRIVLAGLRGEESIAALCRREGILGQFEHPTYLEAVTHICETANKYNRSLGQLINSIPEGKTVLAKEYDFICYGTDTSIYQRALLEGISELRRVVKN